jgi:predicted permease
MRWYQRFFRRKLTEKHLDAELRFHLEQRIADLVAAGIAPEEARRQARLEFGGLDQVKEECRDIGGSHIIETFVQDLRYGLRQLRRNPGFTTVAIITLALGIGANTAIFSVVDAVLLRNLPVRDPGRLVLFSDNPRESMGMSPDAPSGKQSEFSYPFYKYVRDNSRSFEGICAFQTPEDTLTVREEDEPGGALQVAQGKMVSGNYFSVLGVHAILGRMLTPADDQPRAAPVAVVSFNYWQTKLAGDRAVVGKTFNIDGVPITIAGVAARGFFGVRMKAESADFWMPLSLRPRLPFTVMPQVKGLLADPHVYWLNMMGRLKPSATAGQARAEVNTELRQYLAGQTGSQLTQADQQKIEHAYVPLAPGGRGLSELRYQFAKPLRILLVVVGLVLLIACANVANLMLARGAGRQKEMAMRLALGGSYSRLVRQILTETMLLAALGAVAGSILAWWGVRTLVAMVAARVPLNIRPDLAVLAFTIGVSILAVAISGLGPALRTTRVELLPALKAGAAPRLGERTRLGLSKTLVVFQIAASLLLMVCAGLLVHSLIDLEKQNLGFSPEGVLLVDIDPELAGYKAGELPALYRQLVDRMNALPGVRSASIGMTSPMSGSWGGFDVSVEGEPKPAENSARQVVPVGPRYFQTEGMRIIAGRGITDRDTESSTPVAVVNQAFVRNFVPSRNPIGHRLSLGVPFKPPGNVIVGVVQDARFSSAREPAEPMLFLSVFQLQSVMASVGEIEVRVAGSAAGVTDEVRAVVRQIDPNLPITSFTTLSAQVDDSLGQQRAISGLTGFFGILGLVLACVGLYGIMAYNVARRTHEFGVRMALGAEKGDVLRMVVGQGLRVVIIGLAVGVLGALALTHLLSSLLYGVKPTDPLTFIAVSLILTAVALLASYIPARRATKVDPMVALRYE